MNKPEYKHTVCVLDGDVFNNVTDRPIRNPALLLERETGCVLAWGESERVNERFRTVLDRLSGAGMSDAASNYATVELGDLIPVETKCYILRRMTEFTATEFHTAFVDKIAAGDENFNAWLADEMKRVPLDVAER